MLLGEWPRKGRAIVLSGQSAIHETLEERLMQAVILAAGSGSRLRPRTESLPKGLLEIGGKPLLEYSFEALIRSKICDAIIVSGFLGELIQERFGSHYKTLKIEYASNDAHDRTGTMYSFARAQELIKEDVLLLESDLLYDPNALEMVLSSKFENCILVAPLSGLGDEVYVCTDTGGQITHLGRNVSPENKRRTLGGLVGISKFSRRFLRKLFEQDLVDLRNGKLNCHYEECVHRTNLAGFPVHAVLFPHLAWTGIDTEQDFKRATDNIFPRIQKLLDQ